MCELFIAKFLKYVFLNNFNGISMLITQIPNPCTFLNEKLRENEPQNEKTFIRNFTKIPAHFIKYPAILSIFFAWFRQFAFLFGWFSSKFQSVMDLSYSKWHIHLFVWKFLSFFHLQFSKYIWFLLQPQTKFRTQCGYYSRTK